MKKKGLIDKAAISFSLSLNGESYALFGGVDPKQIVGGSRSLVYFKNHSNKHLENYIHKITSDIFRKFDLNT